MTETSTTIPDAPVRVLVVDDEPELRVLFKLLLEVDGPFTVVGEAADGVEGVALAEELQPDVVLLDRSMPRMTGLEALPQIRHVAPNAAVVLYTAENDEQVQQAAIAGGALDVMTKGASVSRLPTLLTDALMRHMGPDTHHLDVRVGPVPADAALAWIDNTLRILDVVERTPGITDQPIDPSVFERFRHYLESWRDVAESNEDFVWAARAAPEDVEQLLDAWASIDRIDEARLEALGCQWSPPYARQFFDALTAAIIDAVGRQRAMAALAERLRASWQPPPGQTA